MGHCQTLYGDIRLCDLSCCDLNDFYLFIKLGRIVVNVGILDKEMYSEIEGSLFDSVN